jgi:hypothetical protein
MDQTDPTRDLDPLRNLAEAADHAQMLVGAQQLAAEVFGAEGAELAAGLAWTVVGTGQATAAIDEHVLVYHRTPILWTRARAATARSGVLVADERRTRRPSTESSGPNPAVLCGYGGVNSMIRFSA